MNIQQFNYILAVADSSNFDSAAEKCFVTQSTLSNMINKFENEIEIKIFNRKTKPVTVTKEGKEIIKRLRIVCNEIDLLKYSIQELKGEISGQISIGIIPTVAPYLLPLIINGYATLFPDVNIIIKELTTNQIKNKLNNREIDIGILALPLGYKNLIEIPLYDEPFVLFNCDDNNNYQKILAKDIDHSKLCLLEESHCLSTQAYNICKTNKDENKNSLNYTFKSGSMESLINITKAKKGITILPYLTSHNLSKEEQKYLIEFESPVPIRSIGLLTNQYFVKQKLLDGLVKIIKEKIADKLPKNSFQNLIKPI